MPNLKKKEKFIVFEGGEGSGKTTQVKLLGKALEKEGYKTLLTHEPGTPHSKLCPQIRNLILFPEETVDRWSGFFLFMADRAQHVAQVIKPALLEGKIVISDRYFISTIAYQHFGFGLPLKQVLDINKISCQNLLPDIVFILNIPPKIGLERIFKSKKNLTSYDKKSLEFHQRVNQGFIEIAQNPKKFGLLNVHLIDATQTIEKIHQLVLKTVKENLF